MNHLYENNKVVIAGEIVSELKYSHEVFGECFYTADLKIKRLSDVSDIIPFMISERLMDVCHNYVGQRVCVRGQFRSFNLHEEIKNRLILSVFAQEIEFLDEMQKDFTDNQIFLFGSLCKEPVYRETPLGRKIADLLIAVNRPYGKSDYIPCICWERNASFVSMLETGTHIQVSGRIQSREYRKKIGENEFEIRTAYEVSVSNLEVLDE